MSKLERCVVVERE